MDIKELDKKQLILLTFLITFVVSIATGIVTVSLMNQMPKSVPQTINNVIQRTIEKVTTVETPAKDNVAVKTPDDSLALGSGEVIVPIYSNNDKVLSADSSLSTVVAKEATSSTSNIEVTPVEDKELGQGIIISDVGLVLVDSSILNESQIYKVVLNKIDFDATIIKKFSNGFTVLKISDKKSTVKSPDQSTSSTDATI